MIRLISRVDIRNGYHIKTVKCEGVHKLRPVADSLHLFSHGLNEYDEIICIDNVASLYGFQNWLLREDRHYYCPIPLSVGGAITTVSDAKKTLRIGADKIVINTAGLSNPFLLREISQYCGRQAVVLQVDAKQYSDSYICATHGARELSMISVEEWLSMAYDLGVGEVHITSVDSEGTSTRFPDRLAEIAFSVSQLPVILSGGIRSSRDIAHFANNYGASAFSLSSIPNLHGINISTLRLDLISQGLSVRQT